MKNYKDRTLQDLLRDIEAAADFDRDLDREIGFVIAGWKTKADGLLVAHDGNSYADHRGGMYPALTEVLSEALALAEKLFPGHGRVLTHMPNRKGSANTMDIIAMPDDPEASATDPRGWGTHYAGKGATEALAACAAIVARAIGEPRR